MIDYLDFFCILCYNRYRKVGGNSHGRIIRGAI